MTVVFGSTLRPESDPLAEIAARLAARLDEPLRLVHVSEDPRAPLVIGTDEEALIGDPRGALVRLADDLAERTGATVRPHLTAGPVATTLSALAELELATVLVLGGQVAGAARPPRRVADRAAQAATVPVLVLREPERLAAWLAGERPLRLLVGADLGRAAAAARRFAASLAAVGPCEVEVLHVADPEAVHDRLGLSAGSRELSPEAEAALLRELSRAAPSEETATLRVMAAHAGADARLASYADRNDFDLVVVGQRRRAAIERIWQGSVARRLLQASPVSVATVPVPIGDRDDDARAPETVVVGIGLGEADDRAIAHAITFARPGALVHLVHVASGLGTASEARQERQEAEYRLGRLVRDHQGDGAVTLRAEVEEGAPVPRLVAAAERLGADLIVLGMRPRGALSRAVLGSVSRALIDEAPIPVLLVPPGAP